MNAIKKGIMDNIFQFSLWMMTMLLMIILIILFVVFSGTKVTSEMNTIAAFGAMFTLSLIASIFLTVITGARKKKTVEINRGSR